MNYTVSCSDVKMSSTEEWKVPLKFSNYLVSSRGNVKLCKGDIIIIPELHTSGHLFVKCINDEGKEEKIFIYNWVGHIFVSNPDPDNLPFIRHINRNFEDNKRENLEWTNVWKTTPIKKKTASAEVKTSVKVSNTCNVSKCKNKKHGKFDECKGHFMERHRKGPRFKWSPPEAGFKTITNILKCYPDIYGFDTVEVRHVQNGVQSKIPLTCLSCGEEWLPCTNDLINHGRGCPFCAGVAPWTFPRIQKEMKERPEIDMSKVTEDHIKGIRSELPVSCTDCDYAWNPSIESLVVNKSKCPQCNGRVRWCLDKLHKEMENRPEIDLSQVTEEHINKGRDSHIPALCKKCNYTWKPTIRSLVTKGAGCERCGGYAKWTLKLIHERALARPEIDFSEVKAEHIDNGKESRIPVSCKKSGHKWWPSIHTLFNGGHGCSKCYGNDPYTLSRFQYKMEDRKEIDISQVREEHIQNSKSRIPVSCIHCHYEWEPTIANLVSGSGCIDCAGLVRWCLARFRRAMKHRTTIDISRVTENDIKNNRSHVPVFCKECGHSWKPSICTLINSGCGCPNCAGKLPITLQTFSKRMEDSPEIDLSEVAEEHFGSIKNRVPVSCADCGHSWCPSISSLINGRRGCPKCKSSKGVKAITSYLDKLGIEYEQEITFEGLSYHDKLKIDIYIEKFPGINRPICIEYDGDYPGSHFFYRDEAEMERHRITVKRDKIKDDFVTTNRMHMIRIPYTCFVKNSIEQMSDTLDESFNYLKLKKKSCLYLADKELYEERDSNLFIDN